MSQPGVIDPTRLTLRIKRELVSPNRWNGRHWRVKHRISQDWEKDISGAVLDLYNVKTGHKFNLMLALEAVTGPKKWHGHQAPKMRVSITRECPSARNFIRDDDNLRFSVKPVLDALKRQGYIRNDSRKWIDLPTPEQIVSDDGEHWTRIELTAVAE